jgi:hypothetical protein
MDFILKFNDYKTGIGFGVVRVASAERAQEAATEWCRTNRARFCEVRPLLLVDETPKAPAVSLKAVEPAPGTFNKK